MMRRALLCAGVVLQAIALCGCGVNYEQSLHSWYVDPTRETQTDHFGWLQNDLSRKDVPGQRLALAFHAWGLGYKVEARAALRAEAEMHREYRSLVDALLVHWDRLESGR